MYKHWPKYASVNELLLIQAGSVIFTTYTRKIHVCSILTCDLYNKQANLSPYFHDNNLHSVHATCTSVASVDAVLLFSHLLLFNHTVSSSTSNYVVFFYRLPRNQNSQLNICIVACNGYCFWLDLFSYGECILWYSRPSIMSLKRTFDH